MFVFFFFSPIFHLHVMLMKLVDRRWSPPLLSPTPRFASIVVMSSTARKAFTDEQVDVLSEATGRLVVVDIPTIEKYGGGSARCMIAEIFT